ncbi:unnamed protein product [Clonostachys solani]|uniref:Uncharacterized protein n=1 Tax=Clonostachys solani TaxID=160281 RepID=A0A9N9ZDA6_9HYPO|nr:unnamed protein product [Clonostachys solani]
MNGTMETPVTTPGVLAEKIDHHWVKHTVAGHKYSAIKSSVFASNHQAQITAAVNDCNAHAQAGLQLQLELLDAIEDQAWLLLPDDIDRVIHHEFACEDDISLAVSFRRSDVLDNLKARQDAAKLAMQSSRKRQSSPTPSESDSVQSCIVIEEDAETPVPETPAPESPFIEETPSPSPAPEDDPDLVATINMRWQEYLNVRQTLDEASNAAFQTASLRSQASDYAKSLKEIATDAVIHQHLLATQLRNVADPPSDALDAMKLRFSGSDLPEFEAEIVRFGQADPPSVSRPKAVATSKPKAVATTKPKARKPKARPANQSSIKSFFAPKAGPSQVVPTPPPTTKRPGKTAVMEPSPAPRRSTRLSNQTPKTVVQDAAASSADEEWSLRQPSDDDASEDDASNDGASRDHDSEDDSLGQTLQLGIEAASDSDAGDQAAPKPTIDIARCNRWPSTEDYPRRSLTTTAISHPVTDESSECGILFTFILGHKPPPLAGRDMVYRFICQRLYRMRSC